MQMLLENANRMADAIGQHVEEEENNRRLSPNVLSALEEAGFHRLFTPKSLGGLEADPVTVAELVEEISLHNTAAGWSMMVANVCWPGGAAGCRFKELKQFMQTAPIH
jgi:alkylation response protein AidB-like acyl-CoA dehydrogenase